MSLRMLLKAEWLKLAKLRAVWIVFVSYFVFLFMIIGLATDRPASLPPITLPAAWPQILSVFAPITVMLCVCIAVLTVATEFTWRTSRQNVIDGLSKTEWYVAKLLSLAIVSASFVVSGMVATYLFARMSGIEVVGQLVRPSDLRMVAGIVLCLAGYLSAAFFLSVTVRNPGVVAVFLGAWVLFVEIMVVELLRIKEYLTVSSFFMRSIFAELMKPERWDAAAIGRMQALGRPQVVIWTNEQLVWMAIGYIFVFLAGGYLIFQKRDL